MPTEVLAKATVDYGSGCPDSAHCQGGAGRNDDWGFQHAHATYRPALDQFSFTRSMIFKRGALMRATWTKGRLWGLVPAAGKELPGVLLTRILTGAKGKSIKVNCKTVRGGRLVVELRNANISHSVAAHNVLDGYGLVSQQ